MAMPVIDADPREPAEGLLQKEKAELVAWHGDVHAFAGQMGTVGFPAHLAVVRLTAITTRHFDWHTYCIAYPLETLDKTMSHNRFALPTGTGELSP